MKKIIIFGITKMSKVITEYIQLAGIDEVVAYTVNRNYLDNQELFNELPLIAFEDITEFYPQNEYYLLNVLSPQSGTKHITEKIFNEVKQKGYQHYTFIDPNAFVAPSARIGENCIICHSSVIEPMAELENGVFIRSGAHISHETKIGAFTYVAPKAALSGRILVEKHCFIGTNATIRDNVTIGHDSVVGAGAVVLKDLPALSVYKAALGEILPIDRFKIKP